MNQDNRDTEGWELYRTASETWGEDVQIDKVGEECSELSAEVSRYMRGGSSVEELAAEAADVEVMLEQLRVIVGDDVIDDAKDRKLARLQDRLREAGADV